MSKDAKSYKYKYTTPRERAAFQAGKKIGFENGRESRQKLITELQVNINKQRNVIQSMGEIINSAYRIDKMIMKGM